MLTNNVLLQKFPLIPRRGWKCRLKSIPLTELRSYEDEPLIIANGQLILTEYTINVLVTPREAAELVALDSRAKGDPILFQDPLDYFAPLNRLVGTRGDSTQGYLMRTGNQRMPVKVYRMDTAIGVKTQYVKPIYYVENLSLDGLTEIPFDPITRGGSEALNIDELQAIGNAVPAQFSYWNAYRIVNLDVGQAELNERSLALSPDCDIATIPVSLTLVETYDWMIDDQMCQVVLPVGGSELETPVCEVTTISSFNISSNDASFAPYVIVGDSLTPSVVQPPPISPADARVLTLNPDVNTIDDAVLQVYSEVLDYAHLPFVDGALSPQTDLLLSVELAQQSSADLETVHSWAIRQGDYVYIGPPFASTEDLSPAPGFTSFDSAPDSQPPLSIFSFGFNIGPPPELTNAESFNRWYDLPNDTRVAGSGGNSSEHPDFSSTAEAIFFGMITTVNKTVAGPSSAIQTSIRNFTITLYDGKSLRPVNQVSTQTITTPSLPSPNSTFEFTTESVNFNSFYAAARTLIGRSAALLPTTIFVPSGLPVTTEVVLDPNEQLEEWGGACTGQGTNILTCTACPDIPTHRITLAAAAPSTSCPPVVCPGRIALDTYQYIRTANNNTSPLWRVAQKGLPMFTELGDGNSTRLGSGVSTVDFDRGSVYVEIPWLYTPSALSPSGLASFTLQALLQRAINGSNTVDFHWAVRQGDTIYKGPQFADSTNFTGSGTLTFTGTLTTASFDAWFSVAANDEINGNGGVSGSVPLPTGPLYFGIIMDAVQPAFFRGATIYNLVQMNVSTPSPALSNYSFLSNINVSSDGFGSGNTGINNNTLEAVPTQTPLFTLFSVAHPSTFIPSRSPVFYAANTSIRYTFNPTPGSKLTSVNNVTGLTCVDLEADFLDFCLAPLQGTNSNTGYGLV